MQAESVVELLACRLLLALGVVSCAKAVPAVEGTLGLQHHVPSPRTLIQSVSRPGVVEKVHEGSQVYGIPGCGIKTHEDTRFVLHTTTFGDGSGEEAVVVVAVVALQKGEDVA